MVQQHGKRAGEKSASPGSIVTNTKTTATPVTNVRKIKRQWRTPSQQIGRWQNRSSARPPLPPTPPPTQTPTTLTPTLPPTPTIKDSAGVNIVIGNVDRRHRLLRRRRHRLRRQRRRRHQRYRRRRR